MVVLTCKNEEDPIKNEGARVLTRLYINLLDAQGQLTQQSVVESGRNSSIQAFMVVPARMKKIHSKLKVL